MNDTYHRLQERYASGSVPWDDPLPPPEVRQLAATLPPGRALDLGTGYGRAAIYLARLGWEVDAVDFIELALAEATRRAAAAGVTVRFHHRPVTDLGFLAGPYDYALDVGCLHSLEEPDLRRYHGHLARLLRPGGLFHLFAHLRDPAAPPPEEGPRGVPETLLRAIFAEGFELAQVDYGTTQVEDRPPWPSGWFRYRRIAADGDQSISPDS